MHVLAVDGRELHGGDEVYSFFLERAGKAVQVKVGPNPDGSGARTVTVVPIADEHSLRRREWMEDNRKKVDALSGGKLAYVYVPDTAVNRAAFGGPVDAKGQPAGFPQARVVTLTE